MLSIFARDIIHVFALFVLKRELGASEFCLSQD